MIGNFKGWHFPPGASSRTEVHLQVYDNGKTQIVTLDGVILETCQWREIDLSSRVGNIARRLSLPGGGVIETKDNRAVDAIERRLRRGGMISSAFRLENSWRFVIIAVVALCAAGYGLIQYAVPYAAHRTALLLPDLAIKTMGEQTLSFLDAALLEESELPGPRQMQLRRDFNKVTALTNQEGLCCQLLFRKGSFFGANALALPGGYVIITDELVALATDDRQILGVLAHEAAHVENRHGERDLLQSSFLSLAIIMLTGDLSGLPELASSLPVLLLEAGYSRAFEHEADAGAAEMMTALGHSPAHLADILQLLEKNCGEDCDAGWLSTHPGITDRVDRLEK